jgi:hypothetical protein
VKKEEKRSIGIEREKKSNLLIALEVTIFLTTANLGPFLALPIVATKNRRGPCEAENGIKGGENKSEEETKIRSRSDLIISSFFFIYLFILHYINHICKVLKLFQCFLVQRGKKSKNYLKNKVSLASVNRKRLITLSGIAIREKVLTICAKSLHRCCFHEEYEQLQSFNP